MNNTHKLIIFILIIAAAGLILSAVCGLSSLGISLMSPRNPGAGFTRTLKDSFSDIDIESENADIRFYASSEKNTRVVWSGSRVSKLSVKTRKGALLIEEKYRLPWIFRIGIVSGASGIKVYLPKDSYRSLKAESDTGDIFIPSGLTFDSAAIDTDTGAVDMQADVRGELKVDTDTGRIALSDIRCRDLKAKSDTGSITLTKVIASDDLKINTDTGSIRLDRCDAGKLVLKSDTGSVTGTLLTDKIFSVNSDTGKIDVPENGSGGSCVIRTDTGSIRITIAGR